MKPALTHYHNCAVVLAGTAHFRFCPINRRTRPSFPRGRWLKASSLHSLTSFTVGFFVAGARAASAVRRRMFRAMRVVSFAPTSASGLTNETFAAISPRQGVVGSIGATR